MPESEHPSAATNISQHKYQIAAAVFCFLLGLAMILNTQFAGEGMWFWHAIVFHRGAHLYSDLHSPLQPLFVLENDLWIQLFGIKVIATQSLAMIQVLLLILGFFLIVRECNWSDGKRGLLLLSAFTLTVYGHAYRFDDYHVVAEILIIYSFFLALRLLHAQTARRELALSALLGVFCGAAVVSRVTDGVALTGAVSFCLLVILRRHKIAALALFFLLAASTVLFVVHLTGDTFSTYLQSTVFKAAASKGGTGSVLTAPFRTLLNVPMYLHIFAKLGTILLLLFAAIFFSVKRKFPQWKHALPAVLILLITIAYFLSPTQRRINLLHGGFVDCVMVYSIVILYTIGAVVLVRFLLANTKFFHWNRREVIYLIPLAIWMSYAAGAAAQVLGSFYLPIALFFLLVAIFQPLRLYGNWGRTAFLSLLAALSVTTVAAEIYVPYSWQNYTYPTMFTHRHWIQHPVYGPMYIDDDLLRFSERVCNDIHATPDHRPELLSLPYPYPNFFCATPPWHNYVQTFFDTSTRPVIEGLEKELQTDPPEWIVYQRQLLILTGTEHWYNHDQPLPQRDLDTLIFSKLQSGEWKLVDYSNYLGHEGGGWYIIHTKP